MEYGKAKKIIDKSVLGDKVNPAWNRFAEKLARIAEQEDTGEIEPEGTMMDVVLATEDYYTERDLDTPAIIATRFNLRPLLENILTAPVVEGLIESGVIPHELPKE
jgi:hypothetical protein